MLAPVHAEWWILSAQVGKRGVGLCVWVRACVLPSSNCTESRVSGRLEGSLLCASSINGKLFQDSHFTFTITAYSISTFRPSVRERCGLHHKSFNIPYVLTSTHLVCLPPPT